ncbi:hypothetical protein IAW_05821 [Bacillus cereus str. Schrouff]|uniref:hypothetical protein n=1 Tax=Bacillus cereus TaxID=1396 RepID=UPI00032DFC31|nr:hypothetical protein [Bacillus cereus]EOO05003.1 hypothetical protein IAW_05821 [Bacillus cereus str. Schrouff]EOO81663.1 hypothetical protein IGY_05685 [Bacillus cereus K-5975c]
MRVITLKKFAVSYLACLIFFSTFVNVLQYVQEPNFAESWGPIWVSIIMYVILGSIPVFIGCLLGGFFYRKIKMSYELKIGIPLFVLLGVFYSYVITMGFSGEYIISFTILDFVKSSIPITLSSLLFYFIRRI